MKTNILFPFFLLPLLSLMTRETSINSTPTKVICLYRMITRPDSTSTVTREELTQLAISDSLSEFRSFIRYKTDSLLSKYQNASINTPFFHEGMAIITKAPKYIFDGVIIKDLKANNCLYYGLIDKVLYNYQDNNYPIKWQVLPDTTSINGYKCQKASTKLGGRNYNAWFTRQIPISNGPYKFGGLPGLIVSISDATNSYKFELIRIYHPFKNYSILLPNQIILSKNPAITVPKQKYYESYFTARKNFIENSIASGTVKFDNEEQVRRTYQERIKHRNNPIELRY